MFFVIKFFLNRYNKFSRKFKQNIYYPNPDQDHNKKEAETDLVWFSLYYFRLAGLLVVDIDLSSMDINQCDRQTQG